MNAALLMAEPPTGPLPEEAGEGGAARGDGPVDWVVLIPRFVHSTKVLIIEAMGWIDRPLSAAELEKVFGGKVNTGAISYHLKSLADLGILIRTPMREGRRGAPLKPYVFAPAIKRANRLNQGRG